MRNATPPATVADFREAARRLPPTVPPKMFSPRDTPTRFLSPIEKATVHLKVPSMTAVTIDNGILFEAVWRLSMFDARGLLHHMSGQYLARELQFIYFSSHPVALRNAHRGWAMLLALDVADLVQVWLSAEPNEDDPRHHRRMRMRDRIAELTE